MSARFANRTILVTGASSGIGRALAVRLAAEGARVILVARDESRLQEAATQLEATLAGAHRCHAGDVARETGIQELVAWLKGEGITVDGVAHCAGIHWLRPLKLTSEANIMEMMQSHVVSSLLLTRYVVYGQVLPPAGAAFVWFSSVAALRGGSGAAVYSAAKGALIAAARALAVELAARRIRINVVSPGVVRTPQSEAFLAKLPADQLQALERAHLLGFGRPEDAAAAAAFLLSDDARWITGTNLVADGGLSIHH